MKKSEIKITAGKFAFYKAMQCREQKSDNVSYHLDEVEAIAAANQIDLALGYCPRVDRIEVDAESLDNEFDLADLDDYEGDYETVYEGDEYTGRDLGPDEIVVFFRHHMYMHYAYDILDVKFIRETDLKTQADLINDADSTTATYCEVFETLDELAEALEKGQYPLNKIHSGGRRVREFLAENGHSY